MKNLFSSTIFVVFPSTIFVVYIFLTSDFSFDTGKDQTRTIILILISIIILLGLLFGICYSLMRRKTKKSNKVILRENCE